MNIGGTQPSSCIVEGNAVDIRNGAVLQAISIYDCVQQHTLSPPITSIQSLTVHLDIQFTNTPITSLIPYLELTLFGIQDQYNYGLSNKILTELEKVYHTEYKQIQKGIFSYEFDLEDVILGCNSMKNNTQTILGVGLRAVNVPLNIFTSIKVKTCPTSTHQPKYDIIGGAGPSTNLVSLSEWIALTLSSKADAIQPRTDTKPIMYFLDMDTNIQCGYVFVYVPK